MANLACISRDGTHFVEFARQLAIDPVFFMRGHLSQPGYSAAILAVQRTFGSVLSGDSAMSWLRAGQVTSALAYVACIPLVYLLARRVFDARAGLVAAGMTAIWPHAAQLAGDVLSDMPHLALYLAAVLLAGAALTRDLTSTIRRSALLSATGLVAAAAYMVRQEAMGVPIATVGGIWCFWRGGRTSVRRRVIGTTIVAASFFLPQTPYMAVTGKFMHKKSLRDLLFGPQPRANADETRAPAAGEPSTLDDGVRAGDAGPLPRGALKLTEGWAQSGRYVFSTLTLIGLLWPGARRADATWRWFLCALMGLHATAVLLRGMSFGVVSSRYAVVLVALMMPWAASGLCSIVDALQRRWPAAPGRRFWIAAWCTIAAPCLWYALQPINREDAPLRIAGEWLRANSAVDDIIVAQAKLSPVRIYADREWRPLLSERPALADVAQASDQPPPARWFVHVERPEAGEERDVKIAEQILDDPRWPDAKEAFQTGTRDRRVHVIRLRP